VTAAVLDRAVVEPEEDERRWFVLESPTTLVEQLVLDRDSGLEAATEDMGTVVRVLTAHGPESADDAWADWFAEAFDNVTQTGEIGTTERSEALHIDEVRLQLSRSYLGGGSMRLRRPRS
jgi:hypothetical protein